MIRTITLVVETSGVDGSATGSATTESVVAGKLLAVFLDYSATQAATTDVTIASAGPAHTLLVVSDSATDGWYYPRHQVHDAAGAGVTYDGTNEVYDTIPVVGYITASAAQADDSESVTVTLVIEQ